MVRLNTRSDQASIGRTRLAIVEAIRFELASSGNSPPERGRRRRLHLTDDR
jgi:hypothetical protein